MMLFRPGPFLFVPGFIAMILGLFLTIIVLIQEPQEDLRIHSLILGSMFLITGYTTLLSGVYITAYSKTYGIGNHSKLATMLTNYHSLEKELLVGMTLLLIGVVLGLDVINRWMGTGYGSLQEMEKSVMAMVLTIMGVQTVFSAIFISLLLLKSEDENRG